MYKKFIEGMLSGLGVWGGGVGDLIVFDYIYKFILILSFFGGGVFLCLEYFV